MKKIICCMIAFSLIVILSNLVFAGNKVVVNTVDPYFDNVMKNKVVVKVVDIVKTVWSYVQEGWKKFKNWFSQLPGIKQYNESVYAGDNWKREMRSMGNEMAPHLKKDSAGAKMLQEGKKKWDNL